MKAPAPKRKRSLRLFWRIYLYGVLLLIAVAVTAAVASRLVDHRPPPWRTAPDRVASLIAANFRGEKVDRERLQQQLDDLSALSEVDLTVFTSKGELVASSAATPPKPLAADEARSLTEEQTFHEGTEVRFAIPLGRGAQRYGYLLLTWSSGYHLARLLVVLVAVLVLLALMPIVLARAIARPLERITATARAIGDGNLSSRTDLHRTDEVGVTARAIDEMADRIEQLVLGEKELLANISHEIRTPLARIRVALELMEEEGDAHSLRQHLAGIGDDLAELELLLDNVLMAARLDLGPQDSDGGLPLHREPVNVREMVAEAAQRFHKKHPRRTVDVQYPADTELPTILGDRTLLRRLLDNLLENAARYSESDAPVDMVVSASDTGLSVQVRDRGIGVDPDDLPRLFEPFFRTDRSRSRSQGGTGLGLTLCKRIVEAHGGSISAENHPDGGLVVRLALPNRQLSPSI